jgi:Skp family chaperone for outer membrane proteins
MKKATLLTLAATVAIAAGIPSLALWHHSEQTNQKLAAIEAQRIEAEKAEAARQQQLEQEREAARQEAARLEQELEQQRQAAERQRQQADLVNHTAEAWRRFNQALDSAASAHSNNAHTPAQILGTLAAELGTIPLSQVDPELATLINDFRSTALEAYQVKTRYTTRMQELDAGVVNASKTGCDVGRMAGDENSLRNCVVGGLLGGFVSAVGASEEFNQLQADYEIRSQELLQVFDVLYGRTAAMGDRLQTTYGISLS